MRTLAVYLNNVQVGTLSEGNDTWAFEYMPEWMIDPTGFDLAPGLARTTPRHQDGATHRPVQWYFDNLLPEEKLRETVSKEAGIHGDDAFALLQYLGAESTGSLVLLPPDQKLSQTRGLQALTDEALSQRISDLPRTSFNSSAPKRMSVAGAQNKLLIVYRGGLLFEPLDAEPLTHILKPEHASDDFPTSVINEFVTMKLADKLGLEVPKVYRHYVPQPVYIVQRFDRFTDANGITQRRHVIDACQLLNKPRGFKNASAKLATLARCIEKCRNKAIARLGLFRWLVFNVLVANDDTHLKNISFMIGKDGIGLAPSYDLLSTGTYHTRAFADHRSIWPNVPMMIPLPGAATFAEVNRSAMLAAARALGLSERIGARELDRMVSSMPGAMAELIGRVKAENQSLPEAARVHLGGELHLMRTMQHLVIPDMVRGVTK